MMELPLKNKQALITGAAGGLGRALSLQFLSAGADLALLGRNEGALKSLADELLAVASPGQTVRQFALDLKDPAGLPSALGVVLESVGAPDILVNNAAVQGPIGPSWKNDWAAWEEAVRVDLFAPVIICGSFVGDMIRKGSGCIINISGGGATGPRPNFSAYGCSKAALVRFSETLSEELKGTGITVNCIAPGALNTRMTQDVITAGAGLAGEKEYRQASKLSLEYDEEVLDRAARLAVLLASPLGEGITGRLISAAWDPWERLPELKGELSSTDIYTLRRIVPKDRGKDWGAT